MGGHKKSKGRKRRKTSRKYIIKNYQSSSKFNRNRRNDNNTSTQYINEKSDYEKESELLDEYEDREIKKSERQGKDPICHINGRVCFLKKYTENGFRSYTKDEIDEIFGDSKVIIADIEVKDHSKTCSFIKLKDEEDFL